MKAQKLARAALALVLMGSTGYVQAQNVPSEAAAAFGVKNMEIRLSAVEDQMREITGKVEKYEYTVKRLNDMLKKMQEDYDMRLTELEKTPLPAPAPTPQAALPPSTSPSPTEPNQTELPEHISGTLGNVHMRGDQVTGATSSPKAPDLPKPPEDYGLTAQEMYDRAFGLLRQANYEGAEGAFRKFIDKYPKDSLAHNANYWFAETYYVRGMFGDAAVAFANAYKHDPSGPKAPDSLLKLSMSLAGVEKVKDACSTLKALKQKYPKASSIIKDRTKSEWNRLKCDSVLK